MSCEEYQNFELGKSNKMEFQKHLTECSECRKLVRQDEQLLGLAGELDQPVRAPLLWAKIENSLRAEKQRRVRQDPQVLRQSPIVLRIAAMLALVVGLSTGMYFMFKSDAPPGNILTAAALQKVENVEQEYIDAISELDRLAQPQLSQLDFEFMQLYQDRLETIDSQIERCKEALENNPANAHIRRYLLAALQDKKETLKEILEIES